MSDKLFAWISQSPLADWVVSSPFIWPTLESIHFVSLCVLLGSLLVVDLRLIGLYREPAARTVAFLIRLSLLAFAVNLATGVLFFFGNTYKYVDNPAFEIKLLLITVAGLNALYYRWRLADLVKSREVTPGSIAVGCLSLAAWSGVIVCGRMITFYAP
jgi:hypothetical protein